MKHASGEGLFEFFVWGWVIVGFFLLINIFLAIIIDSYIKMKEEVDPLPELVVILGIPVG
jgi:hypothetical protein